LSHLSTSPVAKIWCFSAFFAPNWQIFSAKNDFLRSFHKLLRHKHLQQLPSHSLQKRTKNSASLRRKSGPKNLPRTRQPQLLSKHFMRLNDSGVWNLSRVSDKILLDF
jgi:hypothetical protein